MLRHHRSSYCPPPSNIWKPHSPAVDQSWVRNYITEKMFKWCKNNNHYTWYSGTDSLVIPHGMAGIDSSVIPHGMAGTDSSAIRVDNNITGNN